MEVDSDEEICQIIKDGTVELTGSAPEWVGGSGWMDTQIIWSKGIPAVAHGPYGEGAHAKEEWVDLNSVYRVAQVHEYAIRKFCRVA
jgi:acetylornithine deacetylase/succinyl-diaminopimelate desuccinylase-like protein